MQTIGMLGGMSWESTVEYYRIVNETIRARKGGLHSAQIVLYSVDFAAIEALQHRAQWHEAAAILVEAGQRVEQAGADFLLICSNTMHKLADEVEARLHIPLLHIADATAEQVRAQGVRTVGLLGTRFTMEEDFYTGRLRQHHGLEVLIPTEEERAFAHRVIYEELCLGRIEQRSKARYRHIIERLLARGAEGIILGCTEIGLLVGAEDSPAPLFDTTALHAVAAVERALAPAEL